MVQIDHHKRIQTLIIIRLLAMLGKNSWFYKYNKIIYLIVKFY